MFSFLALLRSFHCHWGYRAKPANMFKKIWQASDRTSGGLKKVPYYSHISKADIHAYQRYFDRALKLSSTLEFERNDSRFKRLLAEAVTNDALSDIDLEVMRLQYVCADKHKRQKHCRHWVKTVLKRRDNDFFPDPWAVITAVFA